MPAAGLKAAIIVNDVVGHVVKGIAAEKQKKNQEDDEILQMKLKNM